MQVRANHDEWLPIFKFLSESIIITLSYFQRTSHLLYHFWEKLSWRSIWSHRKMNLNFIIVRAFVKKGDTREYYNLLEITTKNPTSDEIKKAYKKASLNMHPDKLAQKGIEVTDEHKQTYVKVNKISFKTIRIFSCLTFNPSFPIFLLIDQRSVWSAIRPETT